MNENSGKRLFFHVFHSHGYHSRNPESDYVISRNKGICRIEFFEIFCFVVGPAESGEGPKCRGEPCIEHVFFLMYFCAAAFRTFDNICFGCRDLSAFVAIISGNSVSPPELSRYTPIVYAVHPVEIYFGEAFWYELDFAVFDNANRFFCKRLHFYKPLTGSERLYVCSATAAMTYAVGAFFNFYKISLFFEVFYYLFSRFISVKTFIFSALCGDLAAFVYDGYHFEIMTFSYFEVIGVVAGSDFYAACSEIFLDIFVCNNGNFSSDKGKNKRFADKGSEALVIWIYRYRCISEKRFGARCSYRNITVFAFYRVFYIPERAFFIGIFYFGV